jgi:hypothetical protein
MSKAKSATTSGSTEDSITVDREAKCTTSSGKSANTPGFLVAVLCAEGILEPMGDKKRVHQACDPAAFLNSLEELQPATGKKPATKAKASAKAKSKAAPKAKAKSPATGNPKTVKTPRKTPAPSRKGK